MLLSQKYFLSVAPLSRDEPGAYAGARRASLPTSSNSVVPRSAPAAAAARADAPASRRPPPQPQAQPPAAAPYHEALTVVTE